VEARGYEGKSHTNMRRGEDWDVERSSPFGSYYITHQDIILSMTGISDSSLHASPAVCYCKGKALTANSMSMRAIRNIGWAQVEKKKLPCGSGPLTN